MWCVRVINERVTCRNSRTPAGKCILHIHQAGYGSSDGVDFYLKSLRCRSQLRCSAILTTFPRLSLLHGRILRAGSRTHKNVSSTIFSSLLGTHNSLLISFEAVTFSSVRMALNILRLDHSPNKISPYLSVSTSSLSWNRQANNSVWSEQ